MGGAGGVPCDAVRAGDAGLLNHFLPEYHLMEFLFLASPHFLVPVDARKIMLRIPSR